MTTKFNLTSDQLDKLVDILNYIIYHPTPLKREHTEIAESIKSQLPEPYCHKLPNGYFGKRVHSLMQSDSHVPFTEDELKQWKILDTN